MYILFILVRTGTVEVTYTLSWVGAQGFARMGLAVDLV